MKYKVSERIAVEKAKSIAYPYSITISNEYGLSQTIWLNEEQYNQLLRYMEYIQGVTPPAGGVVVSTREYERP